MPRQMFIAATCAVLAFGATTVRGQGNQVQETVNGEQSEAKQAVSEIDSMLDVAEAEFRELICTRAANVEFKGQKEAVDLALDQEYVDERFNPVVRKVMGEASQPDHWDVEQILLAERMLPLCTFDAKERTELVFRCYVQTTNSRKDYYVRGKLRPELHSFPDETSRLVAEYLRKGERLENIFSIAGIVGESSKDVLQLVMKVASSDDLNVSTPAMYVIPDLIDSLRKRERAAEELANRNALAVENVDPKFVVYAKRIVERYDRNNDGELTQDEWEKMLQSPIAADLNGNKSITANEYAAWMQSRQSR